MYDIGYSRNQARNKMYFIVMSRYQSGNKMHFVDIFKKILIIYGLDEITKFLYI